MVGEKSLSMKWEGKLTRIPSPLLMVIGPILGIVYISVVPIFTVITFILTGGYYAIYRFSIKRAVAIKSLSLR
ncbi:MAG: hypothetical protein A2144_08765 [Chloroflexi bacterium RBG_16_50_9]|nr:MAG: hypothetical protein A2144_08765 [Chloroflexi bacterium RBG_16_50_9]